MASLAAVCRERGGADDTLRFGKIPSTVRNVGSLYLYVAERKGFFAREGIKLESVLIEGGTDRMVAAIDDGKVDLAHSSTPYLISAVLKGSNAVGIAGEVGNPVYTLIVAAGDHELRRPAGQADRALGRGRHDLDHHAEAAGEARRQGRRIQGQQLVGTPVRFACLKSGDCAGVPLGQPADIAR